MTIAEHTTFQVGDYTYRAGRLSTFDQLELATTGRQIFFNLALLEQEARKSNMVSGTAEFVQAMCGLFGTLPKPERDILVQLALKVVSRGRGKNNAYWDPAYLGEQFMFSDLDMPELLEIIYRVIQHNGLIRFFSVNPGASAQKSGPSSLPGSAVA